MSFIKNLSQAFIQVDEAPQTIVDGVAAQQIDLDMEPRVEQLEHLFVDQQRGKHLWRSLFQVIKKEIVLFVSLGLLLSVIVLLIPPALKMFFLALPDEAVRNAAPARALFISATLVTVLMLAKLLLSWLQSWYERKLSLLITQLMIRLLFRRLQRIDPAQLSERNKEPLLYLTAYAPQLTQAIYIFDLAVTTVLILVLAVSMVWQMGIVAVGILVAVGIISCIFQFMAVLIGKIYYQYLSSDHGRVSLIQSALTNTPTIIRQYLEPQLSAALDKVRAGQTDILRKRAWLQSDNRALEDNVVQIVSLVAVGLVLRQQGIMSATTLFPVLSVVSLLLDAVRNNLSNVRVLRNTVAPTHEIEQLIQSQNDPLANADKKASSDSEQPFGQMTIIHPAIKQSWVIPAGSRVAVLGQTGSGKSTFLSKLAGRKTDEYFSSLDVCVSGQPALVERNHPLFDGTITQNVTLWSQPLDELRYEDALYRSGLADDLAQDREGDARWLNSDAHNLSEGQQQRLAIAQALYAQTDVLLLDDSFASMNPALAERVATRMLVHTQNRPTCIFVTSRIEMARYADFILLVSHKDVALVNPNTVVLADLSNLCTQFLGNTLGPRLCDVLQHPKSAGPTDIGNTDGAIMDRANILKRVRQSGGNSTLKYTLASHNTTSQINLGEVWANAYALFPPWVLGVLAISMVVYLSASIAQTTLIAGWNTVNIINALGETQVVRFGLLAAFVILGGTASWLRYVLSFLTPIQSVSRIHRSIVQHVLSSNTAQNQRGATEALATPGQAIGRLTEDFSELEMEIPNGLMAFCAGCLDVAITLLVLIIGSPLAFVPLALMGLLFWRSYRHHKHIVTASAGLRAHVRSPLLGMVNPTLSHPGFFVSRSMQSALATRFSDLANNHATGNYWAALASARVSLTTQSLGTLMFIGVLWPVVCMSVLGLQTPPGLTLSAIVFIALTFAQRLTELVSNLQSLIGTQAAMIRIAEMGNTHTLRSLAQLHREKRRTPQPRFVQEPGRTSKPAIAVHEVVFGHTPDLSHRLFDGLSMQIEAGQRLAIVGPSGVGKSSLARIVAGSLSPQSGCVEVFGLTPNITGQSTRDLIWYLESDVPALPISLHDFLDPLGERSESEINNVFTHLQVCPSLFNQNLNTLLDKTSLGQRQILNLMRAILHAPRVMILDEATSGLDSDHERHILQQLNRLLPATTLMAIMHRTDNLDLFHRVLPLDSHKCSWGENYV